MHDSNDAILAIRLHHYHHKTHPTAQINPSAPTLPSCHLSPFYTDEWPNTTSSQSIRNTSPLIQAMPPSCTPIWPILALRQVPTLPLLPGEAQDYAVHLVRPNQQRTRNKFHSTNGVVIGAVSPVGGLPQPSEAWLRLELELLNKVHPLSLWGLAAAQALRAQFWYSSQERFSETSYALKPSLLLAPLPYSTLFSRPPHRNTRTSEDSLQPEIPSWLFSLSNAFGAQAKLGLPGNILILNQPGNHDVPLNLHPTYWSPSLTPTHKKTKQKKTVHCSWCSEKLKEPCTDSFCSPLLLGVPAYGHLVVSLSVMMTVIVLGTKNQFEATALKNHAEDNCSVCQIQSNSVDFGIWRAAFNLSKLSGRCMKRKMVNWVLI